MVVEALGYTALASLLWYGGVKVVSGEFSVGGLVAFFSYIRRFFQPLTELSGRYSLTQSAMTSLERVFELIEAPRGNGAEKRGGRGAEEQRTRGAAGCKSKRDFSPAPLLPSSPAQQWGGGAPGRLVRLPALHPAGDRPDPCPAQGAGAGDGDV
ncbi:MAG: hypothetical protein HYS70_06630 [Nitrospinae bacterium]|nr:hypothetical protein [Nitrospinota bacterium]